MTQKKKRKTNKQTKHSTAQRCLAIFICSSRLQHRDGTLYAIEESIHVLSRAGARCGEATLQIPAAMIQDMIPARMALASVVRGAYVDRGYDRLACCAACRRHNDLCLSRMQAGSSWLERR